MINHRVTRWELLYFSDILLQEIDNLNELSFRIDLTKINTNLGLGESHVEQGNHLKSIQFFQESLRLISEIEGSDTETTNDFTLRTLNGLGIAYRNLGNYQLSLNFFGECLQFASQTNSLHFESIASTGIGNVYANLGNPRRAREYYERALISEPPVQGSAYAGQVLRNLGGIYTQLEDYQQAKDYYEQGLEIARNLEDQRGISSALVGLNEISNTRGNGLWARGYHDEVLEIARGSITDPTLQASVLRSIGNSFLRIITDDSGDTTVTMNSVDIDLLEEALTLYENADARDETAHTRTDIARAYLRINQPKIAEEYLISATQIYDGIRTDVLADADRISLFQSQLDAFSLLQEALTDQGKFEAALVAAERGRARALAALLSQRESSRSPDLAAGVSPDITDIQRIAQQTESTLVTYSIVRDVDQNYDWNRFFSGSGVGYEFNYSLYIWVTSSSGKIAFRQVSLTDIDLRHLVADSRQAMGLRRDRGGLELADQEATPAQVQAKRDEKLRQLHDVLIDPISDFLPTDPNQPVVFIPQGELFLVPFPALKDDNGNYLIENHTILTAPSIQALQLTHNLAESRGDTTITNPVIVGDPVMPSTTFLTKNDDFKAIRLSSLPGARQEAQAVSDFLNLPALIGEAATEATVKQQLPTADLIHLATHGLLEYGDPRETGTRDLPGAIALAPGSNEDGLLTSAEILELDLQADLVVLSACDTGLGTITGDGVIGLSRSLIAAGAPSVIVSLWSIPDAPTAELMTEFYRQRQQGKDKAQALRQAMLITMESHPNPVDWAAFTLIGAAE
jgi:CHAT domain-containing protein